MINPQKKGAKRYFDAARSLERAAGYLLATKKDVRGAVQMLLACRDVMLAEAAFSIARSKFRNPK